ncbi:MAG: hypothetical protein WCO88_07575 [Actinomycetota bacterium]|jgi:hypothetical protein
MARSPGDAVRRFTRAATSTDWVGKAKQAADTLKTEYEAGKRGDDSPSPKLWGNAPAPPTEGAAATDDDATEVTELTELTEVTAVTEVANQAEVTEVADQAEVTEVTEVTDQADVDELTELVEGIDWAAVRASTAARAADTTQTVRTLAGNVDWDAVQPLAAQVSSALIAAVAAGQLPIGGRIGGIVARAMVDQGGLGQRLGRQVLADQKVARPELRQVIDVVGTMIDHPPGVAESQRSSST